MATAPSVGTGVSDGAELLALFMHPDGKRWVAWTPQGYYDASAGADDLIGWQVNHGYDQAPDFFPASQFQERFNRRDVVARVLDTLDVDQAVEQANIAAGQKGAKAAPLTTSALTPVVEIKDPAPVSDQTNRDFTLTYVARLTNAEPIQRVEARIDGAQIEARDVPILDGRGHEGRLAPLHAAATGREDLGHRLQRQRRRARQPRSRFTGKGRAGKTRRPCTCWRSASRATRPRACRRCVSRRKTRVISWRWRSSSKAAGCTARW